MADAAVADKVAGGETGTASGAGASAGASGAAASGAAAVDKGGTVAGQVAGDGAAGGAAAGSAGAAGAASGGAASGETKPAGWGDDWRQRMAGDDAAELKRLERFNTPTDVFRSYREIEKRLSSGELKSTLKQGATQEEIKAWRAENSIPDSPEGYKIELKNGLVIGDADKPLIEGFLKAAHGQNLNNAQASAAVEWYFSTVQAQSEARANADKTIAQTAQDALRAEWGNEYRPNINAALSLLDGAPAGLKDQFLRGRLADGTPLGSSVPLLQWMAQLAREVNPAATLVPGAGANTAGAIDTEIEGFEKKMKDKGSDYWKGPNAEKNQARYRELVAARERIKK